MNEEEILRNDVMFSVARDSGDISALEDRKPNTNIHTDVSTILWSVLQLVLLYYYWYYYKYYPILHGLIDGFRDP